MKKTYEIGDWNIQPELNCISNGAELVQLEPKVMQVLVELSEHAGDVVHKEDLIRSVWPNTFVGDDVLTRCIYELRRVFNDNPRSPRFIQTISKQGYRLIAKVTFPSNGSATVAESALQPILLETPPAQSTESASTAPASSKSEQVDPVQSQSRLLSRKWLLNKWMIAAATFLVLILAVAAYHYGPGAASHAANFKTVPFTSLPGSARQPAFAPDGNKIVFMWNGEDSGEFWNLYVKPVGSETLLRLTSEAADDLSPGWSPDGNWIAFTRRSRNGDGIYLVPAIGGPERKLYDLHGAMDPIEAGLSWSRDGKQLVFPDGKSESNPSSIVSLSLDTLQVTPITHPKSSWDGDFSPAFSPDGKMIAFVRGADLGSRSLYVVDANGGEPKRLTLKAQQFHGLAWVSDGSALVFSSDAGGKVSLWRVPVSGGTAERLAVGSDKAYTPAISPKGDRLAYSQGSPTWSIMRIDLRSPHSPAYRLISSKEQDFSPSFSHDGKSIAFQSWRSGTQEIWTAPADAAGLTKLTSLDGPLAGSPSWSPDNQQIAFDSRADGFSHIFVMGANGGMPRRLTEGEFTDIRPDWSHDGKSIYFASRRPDSWQVWKASVDTSRIQQVTTQGGFVAKESADGNWIYYTKYDAPGLWRMPSSGGDEIKVLDDPPAGYWASFAVGPTGIYFLVLGDSYPVIAFYDFAHNNTSRIYTLGRRPARCSSLSISPDDRWLLYTDSVSKEGDIVLVENFH